MPRYLVTIYEIRESHFEHECADEMAARDEASRVMREEGCTGDYYEVSVWPIETEYDKTTARVAAAVQRVDALLRNDETC